jgi:hypothetical protein
MLDDFDKRFEEHRESIHKMQRRAIWLMPLAVVVNVSIVIAVIGGATYAIVFVLRHFGIV